MKGAAILAFLLAGQAAAGTPPPRPFRLCVLDQIALLQKSRMAIDHAARFQQLRRQAQGKLDEDRRVLEADIRALDALRASIPAAAAAARMGELASRKAQLGARADQLNHDLDRLDTQLTDIVMKAAMPVLVQVENDRQCSVLAAKATLLAVNDPSLDLTDDLVARMNAAYVPRP